MSWRAPSPFHARSNAYTSQNSPGQATSRTCEGAGGEVEADVERRFLCFLLRGVRRRRLRFCRLGGLVMQDVLAALL